MMRKISAKEVFGLKDDHVSEIKSSAVTKSTEHKAGLRKNKKKSVIFTDFKK